MKKFLSAFLVTLLLGSNLAFSQFITNAGIVIGSPANGLSLTGGNTINLQIADSTHIGALSSTDWAAFNGKQNVNLANGHIFVGNASNIAADVAMNSDVSIINTGATTVNSVGGSSAANIHSAELAANAATNANTPSTIVKRDGSGNFSAGALTLGTPLSAGNGGTGLSNVGTKYNALMSNGTSWASSANPGIQNAVAIYVDFQNGDDTNGDGTAMHPYKTLAECVTKVGSNYNSTTYDVYVLGEWTDNETSPVHWKPNMYLFGASLNGRITPQLIIDVQNTDPSGVVVLENAWIQGGVVFNASANPNGMTLYTSTSNLSAGVTYNSPNGGFWESWNTMQGSSDVTGTFVSWGGDAQGLTVENGSFVILNGTTSLFAGMTFKGASSIFLTGIYGLSSNGVTISNVGGNPSITTDAMSWPASVTGTVTLAYQDIAKYVGYTPTTSGNWTTVPTTVLGALDTIGAGNLKQVYINGASSATNAPLVFKDGHLKSTQTTAPTASVQAAAGTGASCSVSNATDAAGVLNLTTTNVSSNTGAQCNVNFNKAYNVAPVCMLFPMNSITAQNNGQLHRIYVSSSTSIMSVNFGVAENTGSTYQWSYQCIETQ